MDKQIPAPGYDGRLPNKAPLANPFVPFQYENSEQYDPQVGFIRGSLYKGLDLPFHGSVNQKPLPQNPLTKLQQMRFVLQELCLYLDTHPGDQLAMQEFNRYKSLYQNQLAQYQQQYGPVFNVLNPNGGSFQWITGPWPWEYQNGMGG